MNEGNWARATALMVVLYVILNACLYILENCR